MYRLVEEEENKTANLVEEQYDERQETWLIHEPTLLSAQQWEHIAFFASSSFLKWPNNDEMMMVIFLMLEREREREMGVSWVQENKRFGKGSLLEQSTINILKQMVKILLRLNFLFIYQIFKKNIQCDVLKNIYYIF